MKSQYLWLSILFSLLAACSSSLFEGSSNIQEGEKRGAESSDSTDASEASANEPVPIGGGFLVCALIDESEDSFGCRIQDENHEKMSITGLRADDVTAYSASEQPLPVLFELAPASDIWHWLVLNHSFAAEVAFVRLSARFVADGGAAARESLILGQLPINPGDFLDDDSQIVEGVIRIGPAPGPANMERIADNQVLAAGYNWYHGEPGQSCTEVCEDKGGMLEAVTAAWTRNVFFCGNLFRLMQPGVQLRGLGVLLESRGLGCFTSDLQEGVVFIEESQLRLTPGARANGVQRYCSCAN